MNRAFLRRTSVSRRASQALKRRRFFEYSSLRGICLILTRSSMAESKMISRSIPSRALFALAMSCRSLRICPLGWVTMVSFCVYCSESMPQKAMVFQEGDYFLARTRLQAFTISALVRPYAWRSSEGSPDSPNVSGMATGSTGEGSSRARISLTAPNRPPCT